VLLNPTQVGNFSRRHCPQLVDDDDNFGLLLLLLLRPLLRVLWLLLIFCSNERLLLLLLSLGRSTISGLLEVWILRRLLLLMLLQLLRGLLLFMSSIVVIVSIIRLRRRRRAQRRWRRRRRWRFPLRHAGRRIRVVRPTRRRIDGTDPSPWKDRKRRRGRRCCSRWMMLLMLVVAAHGGKQVCNNGRVSSQPTEDIYSIWMISHSARPRVASLACWLTACLPTSLIKSSGLWGLIKSSGL